jgi:hypothetical protein
MNSSNSNDFTSSILQSSNNSVSDIFSTDSFTADSSSSSSGGFLETLQNISVTTWLLIVLILAFFGFNIFLYLAKGTEEINSFFAPLLTKLGGLFGIVTGQVVDVSAEGAKAVVNTTAGAVDTGLSAVQDITPNKAKSSMPAEPVSQQNQHDIMSQNTLNKALNSSQSKQPTNNDYEADDATSNIQGGAPKPGWCYVGEDRGFRTCAQVGVDDKCMSGNIFPSQEICINPSLRA